MTLSLQPLIAYIPMDRRQAIAAGRSLPDRTHGAALFADISGFTPLTEALADELGRRRGAEELTRQLNNVYTALVERVHQFGGSVISFSGDAITCWFDRDDGVRATACALAIQQVMRSFAQVRTPGGQHVPLAIKVALTTGPTRRFLVGDPAIQVLDVLAGSTLDRMAAAEKHAEKGEIVIGPAGMAQLGKKVQVREWREDPKSGERYAVLETLRVPVTLSAPWRALPPDALQPAQIRPWLLPPVYERLRRGQGQFLAELRPAVTLFLRFTGLDFDDDDAAGHKLDAYLRWVQQVLARYEGYLLQVTVGDKGSYLYAAYGAPLAHGDDTLRAVAAAMELRTPPQEFAFITGTQIGISQGRMRTGAYGGEMRLTYGVLGDEVNTSARLMGVAQPGQVLVSERVAQQVARQYVCRSLGSVALKGKKEPMQVCEVLARQQPSSKRPSSLYTYPLVGREEDLAQLLAWAQPALENHGQIVRIEGGAGIGKSHLAAEFSEMARTAGFNLVVGAGQSTTQSTPYYPWRQVWRTYFEIEAEAADGDRAAYVQQVTAQVTARLQALNPDWPLRLPLLGDVLGIAIPDNPVTASFDPRLRQEALFTLVVDLLLAWARERPLHLLLEDVHWMDEASLQLTTAVGREIAQAPILMTLVQRPPLQADKTLLPELAALPYHHPLTLGELATANVETLIMNQLGGRPTPLTLALIQAQAQGNPFFVEELVDSLREAGHLYLNEDDHTWRLSDSIFEALRQANCLIRREAEWVLDPSVSLSVADLGIPDSIHGSVLSRLDRLTEEEKLTVKVASVIGRTFGMLLLNHAHPNQPTLIVLRQQIDEIAERDFVRIEVPEPQLTYIFKHNTTQEVSYETLLFEQRRELHRVVAAWYEQIYGDGTTTLDSALAPYYTILAYHWRQAEDRAKERLYARLAGEQAAARFANEEAVTYFGRALDLTPVDALRDRYQLLRAREAVYHLAGQREQQAQDLIQLQMLATAIGDERVHAEVALRFANYYEAMSDYDSALMIAQQAVSWAEQADDAEQKVTGLITWAFALWRRGSLDEARTYLEQALALAHEHENKAGEATSLHHLGTVLYISGDPDGARTYLEQALALRREIGNLVGEAGSLTNLVAVYHALGDYSLALSSCQKALDIYRAIGNRREEATALNNLAGIHHALGDLQRARQEHTQAVQLYQTLGNRYGESLAANNLGLVLRDLGEPEAARAYALQALAIDRDIKDRVGEGYSLTTLGLALEALQAWAEAAQAYEQAIELRRQIGQEGYAIDNLAGLARVALRQGQGETAVAHAQTIQAWIAQHTIHGVEYPLRVYMTLAEILDAHGEAETAAAYLQQAAQHLQEQASHISDAATQQAFLQNVPLHQELQQRLQG
ncbi:MAG: tetratricopeptide repeat protein [Anaerolineales bacterium]|nr:tetratricopeptide repeat protein [Anaerolineales bacterium]